MGAIKQTLNHFLIDTNVLLADVIEFHPHHTTANAWFQSQTNNSKFFIPRLVQISFLRLLTSSHILKEESLTNEKAILLWNELMHDSRFVFLPDEKKHLVNWPILGKSSKKDPGIWMDAYLACLAMDKNLELVTFDKGFKKMTSKGLKLNLLL
ncbi:MAG: PIN domain-containing protein [Leptospira sp.]|nr:PIN domain-containing protein [Leptospira sp.]